MSVIVVPDKGLEHSITLLLGDAGGQVLIREGVEIVVADNADHRVVRSGNNRYYLK